MASCLEVSAQIDDMLSCYLSSANNNCVIEKPTQEERLSALSLLSCSMYLCVALTMISFRYHRRVTETSGRDVVRCVLTSSFERDVFNYLDTKLLNDVFADTAFIDACLEDNNVAIKQGLFTANLKAEVGNQTEYLGNFIHFCPATWFDQDVYTMNNLVFFCLERSFDAARVYRNQVGQSSFGPSEVFSSLVVNLCCEAVLDSGELLEKIAVFDSPATSSQVIYNELLTRFNQDDIDHLLDNLETTFD